LIALGTQYLGEVVPVRLLILQFAYLLALSAILCCLAIPQAFSFLIEASQPLPTPLSFREPKLLRLSRASPEVQLAASALLQVAGYAR